jgi:hypothetical protein
LFVIKLLIKTIRSKMKIKKSTWAVLIVATLSLSSCYYHNWENLHPGGQVYTTPCAIDTGTVVSYSTTVQPILVAKCSQSTCHDGNNTAINDFRTFGDSVNFTGTAADFWASDTSVSSPSGVANGWQYITGTGHGATDKMPKSGYPQLTPCEMKAIGNWIHHGGKDN